MDLSGYIKIGLRWWWLIAVSVILSATASYFYSQNMPKVYAARTTLMVGSNIIENPNPNLQALGSINTLASVYSELAKRKLITQAVIDKLGLQMSPDDLAEMIQTNVIAKAQLLEIFVLDIHPQRAQILANAIAEELILQSPTGAIEQQERDSFIRAQIADLQAKIGQTDQRIKELEASMENLTSAVEIAEAQSKLSELEKLKNDYQSSYNTFLGNLSETSINRLAIFEPASEPTIPVAPNIKMNVLVAAAAGLALAISAIVLLEFFSDTLIWKPEENQSVLGFSVLGAIGKAGKSDSKVVVQAEEWSPETSALRDLRSSLFLAAGEKKLNTLLITSTVPGEGKTFISTNLAAVVASPGSTVAAVIASPGLRVILVDADLRKPSLHEIFDMPNLLGLSDVLALPEIAVVGMLEKALKPTSIENLFLLPAGRASIDSGYLLNSPQFGHLLELLAARADLVIIDSAPLLAAIETRFIAKAVDATLLVINDGRTRRRSLQKAIGQFRITDETNLLGVVFNRVKLLSSYANYSYHYSSPALLQHSGGPQHHGLKRQPAWLGKVWPFSRKQGTELATNTLGLVEVADYLGVHKDVAQRWCEQGRLPATKKGRRWVVNLDDLNDFISTYQYSVAVKLDEVNDPSTPVMDRTRSNGQPGASDRVTRPDR